MAQHDQTLERTNVDWSLYVSDFAADRFGEGYVAARVHVRPTARVKVEQSTYEGAGPQIWIAFGPHAQLYLPRDVAQVLCDRLTSILSAGASVGTPAPAQEDVPVTVVPSPCTVTAPAENPHE